MTGQLVLDSLGDREPDYWIMDMYPNGSFIKIAEVLNTDAELRVRTFSSSDTLYVLIARPFRKQDYWVWKIWCSHIITKLYSYRHNTMHNMHM